MAINFPDSPNSGDSFTSNNKTWVYDGTVWNITSGTNSVADGAITAAKLASNAVHQTHLTSGLSGITVTTTANRSTDVPSPFTGQTIYLSDVKRVQIWDGSAWMFVTNGAPGAPTALSATPLSTASVSIAFTTGTINGAAITNYKYAYSSDSGSTYSEFTALDPVDITSPIVISGLTGSTAYLIKLRAVSAFGDSVDSSPVSVTTLTAPSAPTSLSATGFYLMARIAFTPGADGGSPLTNYEYALSTNSGANYGAFTALSPADATSPIDITGLANSTTYSVKIRAVSSAGSSAESSAVSVTTNQNVPVQYLVVAGGGSGARSPNVPGGGGGAGGVVTHTISATSNSSYPVSVGAGGPLYNSGNGGGNNGSLSSGFGAAPNGGGTGSRYSGSAYISATPGGSGGGGGHNSYTGGAVSQGTVPAGATFYGNVGGTGQNGPSYSYVAAGGGGAGAAGTNGNGTTGAAGSGGIGVQLTITGSAVYYAGGGGAGGGGAGGTGGGGAGYAGAGSGTPGTANTGGGGGGNGGTGYSTYPSFPSGAGGSGVIIVRYLSIYTITLGAGLTASHTNTVDGSYKYTRITAGSGNVSWA